MNVFIVEYRGYGKSTGYPSEVGLQIDAQSALNYLKSECKLIDSSKLIAFGRSLGASVAIDVTLRNMDSFRGLIIENTFTSISDMVEYLFPLLKYHKFLSFNKWDSIDKVKYISEDFPVYFILGKYDEVIPPILMKQLFYACSSTKKKINEYPGYHNETYLCENYYEDMNDWICSIFENDN